MKRILTVLAFLVIVLAGCKNDDMKSARSLEATMWSSSSVANQAFEFGKMTFVYTQIVDNKEIVYQGNYSIVADDQIVLSFINAQPSQDSATFTSIRVLRWPSENNSGEMVYGNITFTTGEYRVLRFKENKLIANYITRNCLNVFEDSPSEDYFWGEKDYYKIDGYDNMYFHLRKRGEGVQVESNDVVVIRYKKFPLTEDADTLSTWTESEQPYEFQYANLLSCEAVGWHIAVKLMRNSESECEIIIPSIYGFEADKVSVTPYVYILRMKVRE